MSGAKEAGGVVAEAVLTIATASDAPVSLMALGAEPGGSVEGVCIVVVARSASAREWLLRAYADMIGGADEGVRQAAKAVGVGVARRATKAPDARRRALLPRARRKK